MLQITRYHKTRFWALWDGSELVAVVVYKKGAVELLRRLAAQPRAATEAAAAAAAQDAAVEDRKSTRLNSSHIQKSRMPSSA